MKINVKEIGNTFKEHWESELTKLTKEYASVCEKPSRFFNVDYGCKYNSLFQIFYPDVKNYNRWVKDYPKPGNIASVKVSSNREAFNFILEIVVSEKQVWSHNETEIYTFSIPYDEGKAHIFYLISWLKVKCWRAKEPEIITYTHDNEDDEDTAEFFASLPQKPREI